MSIINTKDTIVHICIFWGGERESVSEWRIESKHAYGYISIYVSHILSDANISVI